MKVAIIGVSGLVGSTFLKVMEEMNTPLSTLLPVASEKSIGKKIMFKGNEYSIISIQDALNQKPDFALFSAGSEVSLEWAPKFADVNSIVIDNSSCWRKFDDIPLVVPEVNANIIKAQNKIIANPNCSTIQLVTVLSPLHNRFKIKRIVVSTYQSVSGSGQKAINQMFAERQGVETEKIYPNSIDLNCFPHGGNFLDNGYTTEEQKLIDETRKILNDNSILVSPTVARVPVVIGHSESVNIEFINDFTIEEIYSILTKSEGVVLHDSPANNHYPMPIFAENKNDVFVGRIRRDNTVNNGLNLWIVADNLRKGAATNAIQIMNYIRAEIFPKL